MDISTQKEWLKKALRDYTPLTSEEEEHVNASKKLLSETGNPFFRDSLSGHFTVGAWLLSPCLDRILLTHHKKLDCWLTLGGHIEEYDDNIHCASLREAREESGIDSISFLDNEIIDIDVHSIPKNMKKHEPEHFHYDLRFFLVSSSMDFIISDESNDLYWSSIDELDSFNQSESTKRLISKWKQIKKD